MDSIKSPYQSLIFVSMCDQVLLIVSIFFLIRDDVYKASDKRRPVLCERIVVSQVEKVVEACDDHLPRTIADIQVALRMCQTTLDDTLINKVFCR